MAKKRSKTRGSKPNGSTFAAENRNGDGTSMRDSTHADAEMLNVNQKDLADASPEDVARASQDAVVMTVLSPHSSEDEAHDDHAKNGDAVATFAAESMLAWKMEHHGVLSPHHDDDERKQQKTRHDFALQFTDNAHAGDDPAEHAHDDESEDAMAKVLVPNIKTYDLNASASGFLGKYIDEEKHPHHYPQHILHDVVQSHVVPPASSPASSTTATVTGSQIPHSKSLILGDDENPAIVLQAFPNNKVEAVEVVAEQSWLITKLTVQLLWALRTSHKWMLSAVRLVWFVIFLLPPLFKMVIYFFTDAYIHRNIIYGLNGRNLLDVYTVPNATSNSKSSTTTTTPTSESTEKRPVVVFFTGGAWIIGYKAWGALIGKVLSACGIVVVTPDYRNFPQGILPDMVDDATMAIQWVFDNVHHFGGDTENVTIVGQSAGAHIAVCSLLERVEEKEQSMRHRPSATGSTNGRVPIACAPSPTFSTCSRFSQASSVASANSSSTLAFHAPPTWGLHQVRSFIGISGPYNIEVAVETFHRHGFDKSVVERIMDSKLAYYSPALRFFAKQGEPKHGAQSSALDAFPPVYLFHGTADKTVSWRSSEQFAHALTACNVPVVVQYFEGKSHTDPIIEDPILGDDSLLDTIQRIIQECAPPRDAANGNCAAATYPSGYPDKRAYPLWLVKLARRMNPF
uniref:Carboxylic ester hydrolase n=1 Tax=Globisporangium ultimum (strain ATCC 200006 / CBS 805.95 / DAOM BR144) TaxID=431595 RepID=K3WXS5_GLOUD